MASFIRRLFGKKDNPRPAPAPKPAPQATGQPAAAAAAKAQAAPSKKTYRPKTRQKTKFTGALGLSEAQKSGIALKQLTGQ